MTLRRVAIFAAVAALSVGVLAGCRAAATAASSASSPRSVPTASAPETPSATPSAATERISVTTANLPAASGSQSYSSIDALYRDVLNHGVACGNLVTMSSPQPASQEATCDLADDSDLPSGNTLTLQLWSSLDAANSGTTDAITQLPGGTEWCMTIGRGPAAAWSVWSNTDLDTCQALATGLGGRLYDSNGDGDSGGGGSAATSTPTTAAPTTDDSETLTISVTSVGSSTGTVTYDTFSGGGVQQKQDVGAHLPWSATVPLDPYSSMNIISMNAQAGSGANQSITCTLAINGRVIVTNTSTGPYAVVSCSSS